MLISPQYREGGRDSMEDAIASQQKEREASEVEELYLDNVQSSCISGLTDAYTNLRKLSIVHCGLTTLEGLPVLPSLEKIFLSDNRLTGGLEPLAKCASLRQVELAGNKIEHLEDLKPLNSLTGLVALDLFNCPVTGIAKYRDQVFELLSSLNSLDGLDRAGEDVEDSEGEEEEEEDEGDEDEEESESDEEPDLNYLTRELGSESSEDEDDYDPDADDPPPEDDFIQPSDDEEREDDGAGPSRAKKPKLDPQPDPEEGESDSD